MKSLRKKDKKYHYNYVTNKDENTLVTLISKMIVFMLLYLAFSIEYITFVPLDKIYQIVTIAIGIISVLLFALASKNKTIEKYTSGVPLIGMLICVFVFNPKNLYAGLLGTINYQISRWNVEYDDGRALFQNGLITENNIAYFSVLVAFAVAFFVFLLVKKAKGIPIILMIAIYFVPSLILSNFNCIAFSFAIVAYAASVMSSTKTGDLKRRISWTVVISVVLFTLSILIGNTQSQYITNLREQQKQIVNDIRFGTDSLPSGDLSKAGELLADNKQRLEVKSEWAKDIYLKGFVGGKYENGKWETLPNSYYGGENNGMLKWLGDNNFSPQFQYSSYSSLSDNKNKENELTIKNVGAKRNYIYTPYSTQTFKDVNTYQNKDSNIKSAAFFGSKDYSYSEVSGNTPAEIMTLDMWFDSPESRSQQDFVKSEKVYRKFVYNSYLSVDSNVYDSVYNTFWKDTSKDAKNSILSVTEHIREVFETDTQYTEIPKTAPKGSDPIDWFLNDYKKGNSIYYASAGVEAFRMAGFPARYVEGYIFNNTNPKNETTLLTSQDAHAWVEVYMDGIGWLPVDVTPGYYYDTYALIELVSKPKEVEKTEKDKNNFEKKLKLDASNGKDKKTDEQKHNTRLIVLGVFTLIFVIIAVLLALTFIILLFRYKRFVKSDDAKIRQQNYYSQITEMLGYDKVNFTLGKDAIDSAKLLHRKREEIEVDEYLRVVDLIEKMIYGEIVLEPFEERILSIFCKKYFNLIVTHPFKGRKIN